MGQEVAEEGALVGALFADEGEHALVGDVLHDGAPDHAHEPAAQAFGPFLLGLFLALAAHGTDVDMVGHLLDIVVAAAVDVVHAVVEEPVIDGVGERGEVAVDDGLDVVAVASPVLGAAHVEGVDLTVVDVVPEFAVLAGSVGDEAALGEGVYVVVDPSYFYLHGE